MMKTILPGAFLLLSSMVVASPDTEDFLKFITENGQDLDITHQGDFHRRFGFWKQSKKRREQREAKEGKFGNDRRPLGKFAAWSADEKKTLNGVKDGLPFNTEADDQDMIAKIHPGQGNGQGKDKKDKKNGRNLQDSEPLEGIWWREDITGSVEYQGQCGSCWSFATAHTVEGAIAVQTGSRPETRLSKQSLIDCTHEKNANFTQTYFNFQDDEVMNGGCFGGYVYYTMNFLRDNGGMQEVGDTDYQTAEGDACAVTGDADADKANCACKWEPDTQKPTFDEWEFISNPYDIANALKNGPLVISVAAGPSMLDYDSTVGIAAIDSSQCADNINHAVTLVGFYPGGDATMPGQARLLEDIAPEGGRDLSSDNFLQEEGRELNDMFSFTTSSNMYYECHTAEDSETYYGCYSYRDVTKDWWLGYNSVGFWCCFNEDQTPAPAPVTPPPVSGDATDVVYTADNVEASTAYWIIKNSWSEQWGEDGYMRVQFTPSGNGWCGMYEQAGTVRIDQYAL